MRMSAFMESTRLPHRGRWRSDFSDRKTRIVASAGSRWKRVVLEWKKEKRHGMRIKIAWPREIVDRLIEALTSRDVRFLSTDRFPLTIR